MCTKVQCVVANPVDEEQLLAELQVLSHEKRGSILSFIARGTREEILDRVKGEGSGVYGSVAAVPGRDFYQ